MVFITNICKNAMILKPRKHTKNPLRNAAHGDKRENRARNAVVLRRFVEISRENNFLLFKYYKNNNNKNIFNFNLTYLLNLFIYLFIYLLKK